MVMHVECETTSQLIIPGRSIGSWLMSLLNPLAADGWGPLLASRNPANNSAPGVRVSTRYGAVSSRGITTFVSNSWSCRCMEGFLFRGWGLITPGWRWFHEPQPISNQSVGWGFRTPCWEVSSRGTTVFVPDVLELWM